MKEMKKKEKLAYLKEYIGFREDLEEDAEEYIQNHMDEPVPFEDEG